MRQVAPRDCLQGSCIGGKHLGAVTITVILGTAVVTFKIAEKEGSFQIRAGDWTVDDCRVVGLPNDSEGIRRAAGHASNGSTSATQGNVSGRVSQGRGTLESQATPTAQVRGETVTKNSFLAG